jgi:signal transduction histidine kinase
MDRATALFRIFQEACTNVSRHVGAGCVNVSLTNDPHAVTHGVRDDGCGIADDVLTDSGRLGLAASASVCRASVGAR